MNRILSFVLLGLLSTFLAANPGHRTPIGAPGAWADAVAFHGWNDLLYSVDPQGTLTETDYTTGEQTPRITGLGPVRVLAATEDQLLALGSDGTLRRLDPKKGTMTVEGTSGAFTDVVALEGLADDLYLLTSTGDLERWDPQARLRIKTPVGVTRPLPLLTATLRGLFLATTAGQVREFQPKQGPNVNSVVQLSQLPEIWSASIDRVFAFDGLGTLTVIDPVTGLATLNSPAPGDRHLRFLTEEDGGLFGIDDLGSLWLIDED